MKKTILVFSLLIVALLLLFQFGKYTFITGETQIEYIMAVIAIVFLVIGLFINKKTQKQQSVAKREIDLEKVKELEITNREYEVLKHISSGLSNKEIAEKLFLSESTIKTHVSNLLVKLNAKRRTQAIQVAQDHQII
ncbi:response regulator transcription factor [uncultured Algibacter sp.]|uniref:response regulator transcription factor n=1 Tax=uncultured Algibacter sp. TaxID=298659 RepID=UPI0026316213|nr:response regulator transcription factor [uncultured Algibacter sp.]